jgi:hypothetical protein
MTILKPMKKPSHVLPYEQLYIQLFYHNNQLIPEQNPNEQSPVLHLLYSRYRMSHAT